MMIGLFRALAAAAALAMVPGQSLMADELHIARLRGRTDLLGLLGPRGWDRGEARDRGSPRQHE